MRAIAVNEVSALGCTSFASVCAPIILDFFHATEHLARAIAAVHGDGTLAKRHTFEALRERLLTEEDGAEAVVAALA